MLERGTIILRRRNNWFDEQLSYEAEKSHEARYLVNCEITGTII